MLLARELPQVNVPDQYLPVDINAARRYIEKAAFHGFAKAQVKMGAAYELCQLGCDFDPMLSLHYNLLAAKQGEAEAEMAISKWFLCGHEGLFEKNDEIAFTYAQRAALSDLPTAEFALGYFYEVGIHVPVDLKEARAWYTKAANKGNKDAAGRIESISRSKTLSRKDHEQVAIARIKSQYGNGGRPGRRYGGNQNQAPPQESLEMPDPSRMTISDDGYSSAPYPTDGRPQYGGPPSGQPYPDSRQSPAFGINPNIQSPPANYGPGGPGSRTPSGQMGYRPPTGSAPTSPRHPPPGQGDYPPVSQAGPQSPRPDFGYSAPLDQDRRRLQRPERPGTGGRPPQDPYGNGGPGQPSPGYPPRNQSMPPSSQAPPHSPRPQGAPASQPSSSSSTPAPSRPGNLPGKGPKTFEEMGVPVAKNESDCVSARGISTSNTPSLTELDHHVIPRRKGSNTVYMFGVVFCLLFFGVFLRRYRVEVRLAQRACFSLYREGANTAATVILPALFVPVLSFLSCTYILLSGFSSVHAIDSVF